MTIGGVVMAKSVLDALRCSGVRNYEYRPDANYVAFKLDAITFLDAATYMMAISLIAPFCEMIQVDITTDARDDETDR